MCSCLGCFVSFHRFIYTMQTDPFHDTNVSPQWYKKVPNHLTVVTNPLQYNCKICEKCQFKNTSGDKWFKISAGEKKALSTLWAFGWTCLLSWGFYRSLWKGQPDGWSWIRAPWEWITSVQLSRRHTGFLYVWELIFLVYKDCDLWIGTVPSNKTKRSNTELLFFRYLEETPWELGKFLFSFE